MHNCIPRNLPTLDYLLKELNLSHQQAAKLLHVSSRTIQNWLRHNKEPYAPRLALFWLSSYGYSIIHTDAHNQAVLYAGLARAYKTELQNVKSVNFSNIKKPLQAANDAVFRRFQGEHDNT